MLTKSQLKDIFSRRNFAPLKRLGENYLIDANVKDKIITNASLSKDDTVLEIGPGFGALTIDIALTGAKIFAVEKDKKACSILKEIVKDRFPDLKLINADILEFELKDIWPGKPIKVIGNLPYYATTPIIEYLIENKKMVGSILTVVQKEVAERLMAQAGSKGYGSISCFVQYHMKPVYIHTIKPGAFFPEPEVDSSLIRLDILDEPSVKVLDEELFFRIVRGSFNQRRKTIMNSLSRLQVLDMPKKELAGILDKAGIDPMSRPEDLPLSAFARLTNAI